MSVIFERKLLSIALICVVQTAIGAGLSTSQAQARVDNAAANSNAPAISVCEERIGGLPYQVTRVLIKATPEEVWQVLTDYAGAPAVFSTLKKCQVLVDRGNAKLVRYVIKPSGLMASFQYDLEVKEHTNRLIEWHRVGGDFKAVDGFWKLEPVECGRSTIVTHANYVNGGFFVPQPLIKHQSRIDLPQIMASLKDRAERTMHLAAHGTHPVN